MTAADDPTPPTDDDTAAEGPPPTGEPEPAERAGEPSSEAAKYRRRLRDAESERDALAGRVEGMQRAAVERQATASLAQPTDIWLAGVSLAELLDADGNLDPSLVDTAVAEVLRERPGWAAPPPPPSFDGGMRTGQTVGRGPTWQQVIKGG